jgi:hypothetical protein
MRQRDRTRAIAVEAEVPFDVAPQVRRAADMQHPIVVAVEHIHAGALGNASIIPRSMCAGNSGCVSKRVDRAGNPVRPRCRDGSPARNRCSQACVPGARDGGRPAAGHDAHQRIEVVPVMARDRACATAITVHSTGGSNTAMFRVARFRIFSNALSKRALCAISRAVVEARRPVRWRLVAKARRGLQRWRRYRHRSQWRFGRRNPVKRARHEPAGDRSAFPIRRDAAFVRTVTTPISAIR